ncbi:MAG: hypothetical protein JEZ03_02045 [Bacteroidales bacterium]|nr:hypothetical protein [Bacteroidales bacterium]
MNSKISLLLIAIVLISSCKKEKINPTEEEITTNNLPMADIIASPIEGGTFTIFTFDASNCTDKEDSTSLLKVRWDWDNDNHWDTQYSTEKIAEQSFDHHGSHMIKMEVKDSGGKTNNTTFIIEIDTNNYVNMGNACPGFETIEYSGQTYNTVLIGDQCWMKENLNIGEMITDHGASDNGVIEKYCYNNDQANCDKYGGLYFWDEIMQYQTEEGSQGICPEGWHIPTDAEYRLMEVRVDTYAKVGGDYFTSYPTHFTGYDAFSKLLSENPQDWDELVVAPTNKSGFAIKGAGSGFLNPMGVFTNEKQLTYLWTSTLQNTSPLKHSFVNDQSSFSIIDWGEDHLSSVRCLKDK